VLHLLPHPGGGAETYIDLLEDGVDFEHKRRPLSTSRAGSKSAISIPLRLPGLAKAVLQADLIHLHGDTAAVLGAPLLAMRPAIVTTHGLHRLRRSSGRSREAFARALSVSISRSTRTLCTSEAEYGELMELLPAEARSTLTVVPNGVPPPRPQDSTVRRAVRDELGLDERACAVLFVGELEERKQPLLAARAAAAAAAEGAPLTLFLAGEGPLAGELGRLAGAAVMPLGFRHDVDRLLAAADVFVLPSEREGLSFAILEAMSAGLATIVAEDAGNAEAVGKAGIVVPVEDEQALKEVLVRLAGDSALRVTLGTAARRRVGEVFTAEALVRGVEAAYRDALYGA
jgi:glycosyltransferase involved in cell wall biosynthesis